MKIVGYNDSYAKKVADMWNKSVVNWGNEDVIQTESDVIAAESSSGNLKVYLAIDDNQVVGYCSLSEYKHDEGASYLPLLNVIPEYHGKKIGKALILKIIEAATESRWPRFDLFTWSGNIKAMPLYKKCGFFWERRGSSVHLMNFIPYVFQTEALSEYLSQIDWYKDSKRVIDMKQDGELRSSFEYYRYDFENEVTTLAVEFEKTGRGLRFIETPDYLIEMTIGEHDLVFDNDYEASFRLVNKSGKDLTIEFNGKDNKNIKCSMNETITVVDEINIKSLFFVGKIDKDQHKGETHPVVEVSLLINGLQASFKIGIEPKYPVKLKLNILEYNHVLKEEYNCYLDVVNNLTTKEKFEIILPNSFADFEDDLEIELAPKEKRSIKVKYVLHDYGFYNEQALIKYRDKTVEKYVFAPLKGSKASFTCLMEDSAYIVSGNYILSFNMDGNSLAMVNGYNNEPKSAFLAPSIGVPYSLEFTNAKPVIEFLTDNDMDIIFSSEAFKDVLLIIHVSNTYGVLTAYYELINKGKKRELALSIPIWMELSDCVIPYVGELLKVEGSDGGYLQNINHEKVDENWIYNTKLKYGVTWDKSENMQIAEWKMTFDKSNIKLDNKESYNSGTFYFSYVHPDVPAFRNFAGNKGDRKEIDYLEVVVNNGNPFAVDDYEVLIKNNRKIIISGSLSVDDSTVSIEKSLTAKTGLKTIDASLKDRLVSYKRLVHEVKGNINLTERDNMLEVSNGQLSFKASNEYADSIFSLQFNGYEWLDSNYPKPISRAWWSDFVGGIHQRCKGLQDNNAIKEKRSSKFVKLSDNFGNEWQGIKISLIIKKDPGLEGLVFDSYYLTLPGVKLIHSFTNVINNSGKLLFNKDFHRFNTLKIDDDKSEVTYNVGNTKYKCNNVGIDLISEKLAVFEGKRKYKMNFYSKSNKLLVDSQTEYTILFSENKLTVPDNDSKQLPGDFIFFTKDIVEQDCLVDLGNIKFDL